MSFRLLEVKILESNLTSLGSLCSRQDSGYPARSNQTYGFTDVWEEVGEAIDLSVNVIP